MNQRRRLGFAFIGTGDIAHHYIKDFLKKINRKSLHYVGAYNRSLEKARSFRKKYGGRVYENLSELLSDAHVDFIVNLTPAHEHHAINTQCLKAGKHVHCEKPIAMNLREARLALLLAKKRKRLFSCAPFLASEPVYGQVEEILESGEIGAVKSLSADIYHGRLESWHPNPAPFYRSDTGLIMDMLPYPISMWMLWFGDIERVYAMGNTALPKRVDLQGRNFDVHCPDQGTVCLRFRSGILGRITFSSFNSTTSQKGMEIQGEKGSLFLSSFLGPPCTISVGKPDGKKWTRKIKSSPDQKKADWSRGIFQLGEAIRQGQKLKHSADLAERVLKVLLAIQRSVSSNRELRVA